MKRWTVLTTSGAFAVYAATEGAARRKIARQGHVVTGVKPRGYRPPKGQR